MTKARPIAACDCETDPFKKQRVPVPFLWGYYDGKEFKTFKETKEFVEFVRTKRIILYAHNGGKFDFIYLLEFIGFSKVQIINSRIVSMMLGECELRDSYAIMPVPLKELGAKKEIEYWKLERENREKYKDEIREYLFYDCSVLFDAVVNYRNAAGKHKTIASNALSFARKLGIDPGKTNHRFDAEYRKFYFGGRTECFKSGEHKNLIMLDIHSAYPDAMMHNHASGSGFAWRDNFKGMTNDEINRSFIELKCFSDGAFPKRGNQEEGLKFPRAFDQYAVTGWEYQAAKELGLLKDVELLTVRTTEETINFKPYVEHWYKKKLEYSAKNANGERIDKANYTISKTMMNSLYGKLAQNPARYYDYKIVSPGTPTPCNHPKINRSGMCKCGYKDLDHGYSLSMEYDKFEFHRRETLWRYQFNYGEDWKAKGLYKNVATGASVTGFVRAKLLFAIHAVGKENVVYCDTDSLVCLPGADISKLSITENIGDWELEDRSAPVGHFAGKKLYAIKLSSLDKKTGKNKTKIASKGSKLSFGDVKKVSQGKTVTWENDAPNFNFLGSRVGTKKKRGTIDDSAKFIVRNIRATAKLVA